MDLYDQVPYDSFPCTVSHPDNLAAIGTLWGLSPTPITACRVLELGCGTGANLIPMAAALGQSQFLGIDLSPVQVESGRRTVQALGLSNIQLEVGDIATLRSDLGRFDYIIAHGVYSWVPPLVQEGLLRTIGAGLTEQGIALVSYSVIPGAYPREALRALLTWGVRTETDPQRRVKRARELIEWAAEHLPGRTPHATSLRRLMGELGGMSDAYLVHDYLAPFHEAVTLRTFVDRAAAHQLQYLADGQVHTMFPSEPDPDTVRALMGGDGDAVDLEQLNDHLLGRAFRSTLLCRRECAVDRRLSWERMRGLRATTWSQPRGQEDGHWMFRAPGGELFGTASDLVGSALAQLAEAHPRPVPFSTLCEVARIAVDGGMPTEADIETLGQSLLAAYLSGQISLGTWNRGLRGSEAEPHRAFAPARIQAEQGSAWVTNLWHRPVEVSPAVRHLLALLDGRRALSELRSTSTEASREEQLSFLAENALLAE